MAENLTGQRFGRLTVLRRDLDETKYPKWICRCDCGNEISVRQCNLVQGRTKSCGCLRAETRKKDFSGQRFGFLTVEGEDFEREYHSSGILRRFWFCRCDCGNLISVSQTELVRGDRIHCGCKKNILKSAHSEKVIDMRGQRFGRLTVMELVRQKKSNGKGSSPAWLCKCDCGKEVIATRRSLLRKDQQSCGCLFSEKASERILKYNTLGMYQGTNTSMIRDTSKLSKSNTSGVRGVCWDASKKKWAAHIGFQSRRIKLGCYNTIEEAAAVRKAAEEQYFAPIVAQYDAEKAKAEEAVT